MLPVFHKHMENIGALQQGLMQDSLVKSLISQEKKDEISAQYCFLKTAAMQLGPAALD